MSRAPGQPAARRHSRPRLDSEFDVALADALARRETYNKHHIRPNTYLHKWWARRCGSTFRLLLKHLVADPDRRDYYRPGGLEGLVLLDPMMGGGTTLHEAIRLGANVAGVDIDPIPVLQARATLTALSLPDLEDAFIRLLAAVDADQARWWQTHSPAGRPTPLRFVLYGLSQPKADPPVIWVDSLILRHEADGRHLTLCPNTGAVRQGDTVLSQRGAPLPGRLVPRHGRSLRRQASPPPDRPFHARNVPLAIAGHCPEKGFFFKAPDAQDLALMAEADRRRPALAWGAEARFAVGQGPKTADLRYQEVHDYRDLFSSRQLMLLGAAETVLRRLPDPHRLNLALLLSTALEFNSLLCGYKGGSPHRPGAIRHVFAHHAFAFPYTALENNPLYPAQGRLYSGTWSRLFHDRIRRARQWAVSPREPEVRRQGGGYTTVSGERDLGLEVTDPVDLQQGTRRFWLNQGSAEHLPLPAASVDYVVTDPPYFDSVQYGDLAAYFHVWLQRWLPEAGTWSYPLSAAAVDPRSNGRPDYDYTRVLGGIFGECRRVLRPGHGRLIFTFHQWKAEGWAALTLALRAAAFRLVSRYVVHSESPTSVHNLGPRSLTDDAILVLAPVAWAPDVAWERPAAIRADDSHQFSHACAGLLGWLLAQESLTEAGVRAAWDAALDQGKRSDDSGRPD